jgi:Flp pilus assembly pilin Flp
MVEYALMLTLIAAVALGATGRVGISVRDVYGIVQTALSNANGGGGGAGGGNGNPSNGNGDGNGGGNGQGDGNSGCGVMC